MDIDRGWRAPVLPDERIGEGSADTLVLGSFPPLRWVFPGDLTASLKLRGWFKAVGVGGLDPGEDSPSVEITFKLGLPVLDLGDLGGVLCCVGGVSCCADGACCEGVAVVALLDELLSSAIAASFFSFEGEA